MKHHLIEVLAHKEFAEADLAEFRQRFDSEHLEEFGKVRISPTATRRVTFMVWRGSKVASRATRMSAREIAVGIETVAIAGLGGVLTSDEVRAVHLGYELIGRAEQSMRERGRLAFGYPAVESMSSRSTCLVVGTGSSRPTR